MSDKYLSFKKYPDALQAQDLQQFLLQNNIECLFVDASPSLGSSFSGGDLLKEYEVQLKAEDFEKAEQLMEQRVGSLMADVPEDYYLLSFTNEELHEVIVKRHEWNEFDYLLAQHLLAESGQELSQQQINAMRNEHIAKLAKPEQNHTGWIVFGYICAFLGGLFGITTGYVLWTAQKTLPNGARVYTYTASDRAHGKIIFVLGIAVLAIIVALKIVKW